MMILYEPWGNFHRIATARRVEPTGDVDRGFRGPCDCFHFRLWAGDDRRGAGLARMRSGLHGQGMRE